MRCGMQYYYRYVEGIKTPPAVAMLQGSSLHKGQEVNFSQKIESHEDAPLDVVLDAVSDRFNSEVQDIENWEDTDEGKAKDQVITVMELVHTTHNPTIQPLECEAEYSLDCNGTILKAVIDLVDDKGRVRDNKLVGKAKSQCDADNDLQLTMYSWVTGLKDVAFDCFVKTKTPKVAVIESTRTERDWNRLKARIPEIINGIEKEVFVPADPTSWACSEKFCGYWHICKHGGKA